MPPIIARELLVLKALGATGDDFSAFSYPRSIQPVVDGLGTARLRRDALQTETVVNPAASAAVLSAVPVGKVRYIFGLGYRTDIVGNPNLTLALRDNLTATSFPIGDTQIAAAVFAWFAPKKLPLIVPEQLQVQLISSTNTTLRIQAIFLDVGLGEYVNGGV